jgi:hypothetical protein
MTTTCIHSPLLTLTIANQYAHRRCRQQGWYECELLASDNGVYKNIDGQRHELWDEVVQSGAEEEFRVGVEERVVFMNFNDRFSKDPETYKKQMGWFHVALDEMFSPEAAQQAAAEAVAILVLSGRANAARRTAIRQTWGHEHANVHFIVGSETCGIPAAHRKPYDCEHAAAGAPAIPASDQDAHDRSVAAEDRALEKEAATHGDLVIVPGLQDTYRGLPAKLKRAYRWALLHTNARWLLNIADTNNGLLRQHTRLVVRRQNPSTGVDRQP